MGFRLIEEHPLTELERKLLAEAERADPIARRWLLGALSAGILLPALFLPARNALAVDLAKLWIQGLALARRQLAPRDQIVGRVTLFNKESFRESSNVRFQVENRDGSVVDQDLRRVTVPAGRSQQYEHDSFEARGAGGYDYESATSYGSKSVSFSVI